MNPSGKPDKNLVNLYGVDSGTPENPRIFNFDVLDGNRDDYTGVIKGTNGFHDAVINVKEIIGAIETHYDFNDRCARVILNVEKFNNVRSEYIGSVKGGCEDVAINGPVTGKPPSKGVHHIDGNWSDQSSAITRGTKLGLICAYGEGPILYDQLNSAGVTNAAPQIINRRLFIPGGTLGISIVWFFWGLLKKLKLA